MHSITISGTPEDQVQFEGEFNEAVSILELQDSVYLAFSDGTLLAVDPDAEEVWRIETITLGAQSSLEKVAGSEETGTDKVTLTNPMVAFQWILIGSRLVSAK